MAVALAAPAAEAGEIRFSGKAGLEARYFPSAPNFPDQIEGDQLSVFVEPEWSWRSDSGNQRVVLAPFLRLDNEDPERSHGDFREAYWRHIGDDWDLLVGAGKVFWGVTESRHLVDIVNQDDAVEDLDGEDKLGQLMVKLSLLRNWGKLDLLLMPYFRERTFPGAQGRLRPPLPIDEAAVQYQSSAEEWHPDLAARYSAALGDFDLALSLFHGTSREPRLLPNQTGTAFTPFYDQITQAGLALQYTRGAWLFKFEGMARSGHGDLFGALVGGFEYTLFQWLGTSADLGLLVEFLEDGRDFARAPVTPFENDAFLGARLGLNDAADSQVLAGAVADRDGGGLSLLVEAQRRLGQSWRIELELRAIVDADEDPALAAFEADDFVTFRLTRFF